jgi:hypothetical protein
MTPTFEPFPKIPRLFRDCIITEKIDGTNATIAIIEDGGQPYREAICSWHQDGASWSMLAGSRTRWITPQNDNHGFARWVEERQRSLMALGPGIHRGEWWGSGIQRGYGLKEKRLSLFNVSRWCLHDQEPRRIPSQDPRIEKWQEVLPTCVGLVPVLYQGHFSTRTVESCCNRLLVQGSQAAPGFQKPEGVVVFHTAANAGFKVTLEKDDEPKSKA